MGYSPRDCKESDTTEVTEQAQEFFIGFPGGSVVKNLPARRQGFDPWVRKIPWRRKWQPTPVFLGNPMDKGAWRATVHGAKKVRYSLATQFSSVAQSCPTLCNPMNHSTPGLPVHHQLLEFTQTHVHRVDDAIQPSHPLLTPSPPTFNLSYHQDIFK